MTSLATSTDPLVDALAIRMRRMDLVAWQRITSFAEQHELSFENLRVLLAVATADDAASVPEIANLAGLSLHAAYPATHDLRGRGYLHEDRRRYAVTQRGQDVIVALDAAHRDGIQAYVDDLDADERRRFEQAFCS